MIIENFYKNKVTVENKSEQSARDGSAIYDDAKEGLCIIIPMTKEMQDVFGDIKSNTIVSILNIAYVSVGAKINVYSQDESSVIEYTVLKAHVAKDIHGVHHSCRCAV